MATRFDRVDLRRLLVALSLEVRSAQDQEDDDPQHWDGSRRYVAFDLTAATQYRSGWPEAAANVRQSVRTGDRGVGVARLRKSESGPGISAGRSPQSYTTAVRAMRSCSPRCWRCTTINRKPIPKNSALSGKTTVRRNKLRIDGAAPSTF